MSINCTEINLNNFKENIELYSQKTKFKKRECGKHFQKHEKALNRLGYQVSDNDSYLSAAQKCLVDTIFKKGFVFRSVDGKKLAFFLTLTQKSSPDLGDPLFNINEPMVSIGEEEDGSVRIHTFYIANGKTAGLSLKHANYTHVACFENGLSARGWQKIEKSYEYGNLECRLGIPTILSSSSLIEQEIER